MNLPIFLPLQLSETKLWMLIQIVIWTKVDKKTESYACGAIWDNLEFLIVNFLCYVILLNINF